MRVLLSLILLNLICVSVRAEEPTTRPLPEGLVLNELVGRRVVSIDADVEWIRTTLDTLEPTTRPTTMPTDALTRLETIAPELAAGLTRDLALDLPRSATTQASTQPATQPGTQPATKPATAIEVLNDRIAPALRELNDRKLVVTYVVLPKQQLVDAVKTGWGEPQLHYNRLANDVSIALDLNLTLERLSADVLVPIVYLDTESADVRIDKLRRGVHGVEGGFLEAVSRRTGLVVESNLLNFVANEVIIPLNLGREREWFGIGVIDVIGGKYASQILGIDRDRWMDAATFEPPRAPVRFSSIDLLNPTDPKDLRPQYFPYYVDAMRRKSTLALWTYAKTNGDDAIRKLLIRAMEGDPTLDEDLKKIVDAIPSR